MKGLRGFNSLRTRNVEWKRTLPKRRCSVCDAVLRKDNLTDTCATPRCSGIEVEPLTDWEKLIIETGGMHGAKTVAKLRGLVEGQGEIKARNAKIRELVDAGWTWGEVAELFNIGKGTVGDVIKRRNRGRL